MKKLTALLVSTVFAASSLVAAPAFAHSVKHGHKHAKAAKAHAKHAPVAHKAHKGHKHH